ncbi:transposon-transfer assisting family protein [Oscillospiraceae bacterium 21-37]
MSFTNDEMNLMCIYNTGTREGTLDALTAMREYLTPEETELRDMTDSVVEKLKKMSDTEFAALDLYPDFDE